MKPSRSYTYSDSLSCTNSLDIESEINILLLFNLLNMKSSAVLHWVPRILMILSILFISLFALDAFTPGNTLWQNIGSFLMNLIPSFILITILIIAWKWERTGGIILTILSLIFIVLVFNLNLRRNHSVLASLGIVAIICVPSLVAGILFLYSSRKSEVRRPK